MSKDTGTIPNGYEYPDDGTPRIPQTPSPTPLDPLSEAFEANGIKVIDLTPSPTPLDISLCNSCGCMTHTVDNRCGKCKAPKDEDTNVPISSPTPQDDSWETLERRVRFQFRWKGERAEKKADHVLQLIKEYGDQRAQKAHEDGYGKGEMTIWKKVRKSYPKKQTLQGNAVSRLTLADVDREITGLNTKREKSHESI